MANAGGSLKEPAFHRSNGVVGNSAAACRHASESDVPPATKQPDDQHNYQDNPEYSADSITATAAIIPATIISEASTKKNYQQYDYKDERHERSPWSVFLLRDT